MTVGRVGSAAGLWCSTPELSTESVAALVRDPSRGAVVCLEGRVRDLEDGRRIRAIFYEGYVAMAEKTIQRLLKETEERFGCRASAVHRLGRVGAGEASVIVACGAAHRPEAFAAAEFLIDAIKTQAPIWKADFEWA
jgi:molybdopterin synthase catalytic subunit